VPDAAAIAAFLAERLDAGLFPEGEVGVLEQSAHDVARLGLALQPWRSLGAWAREESLDALFLHRRWGVEDADPSIEVPVVFAHLPFDERLTTGWNPRLAAALGMHDIAPLGEKAGRPLGMIGDVTPATSGDMAARLQREFGALDDFVAGAADTVTRVAVVGGMSDALVREAAARGAQLYVTGQWRVPATRAVRDTGLSVAVTGHARAERWGLAALARMLRERWPAMDVVVEAER
jgi:putative NIF3 family GTP cyclohydrolase 1 type 2